MNLLAARIALRPRPLSDVLDLALPFCVANRRPLAVIALATLGPVAAFAAYLRLRAGWCSDIYLVGRKEAGGRQQETGRAAAAPHDPSDRTR